MPGSRLDSRLPGPRDLAARVLAEIFSGRSLDVALERHIGGLSEARDISLVRELSFGTLRFFHRLDAILVLLLKRPLRTKDLDIKALLLLGLYQLIHMRVPDHAAVSETANAARRIGKPWAVDLINGVLRNFQRKREELSRQMEDGGEASFSCPEWLLEELRRYYPGQWRAVAEAMNERPPMSLRVNAMRSSRESYIARLKAEGMQATSIDWTEQGVVLSQPVDIYSLPGFAEGLVSVQDGGSQLAAVLLNARPGHRVLDACSAPGGKACHILESAAGQVELTAMDNDEARLKLVRENMDRLGLNARLVCADASSLEGEWRSVLYDRILLDVPCSATGVIRRHPDIKLHRRPSDVPKLAIRQAAILDAIWPLLAPGGVLVYVTCSLLPQENENQVSAFISRHSDARDVEISDGWGEARSVGRQILPGSATMDGFFYTRLKKMSG